MASNLQAMASNLQVAEDCSCLTQLTCDIQICRALRDSCALRDLFGSTTSAHPQPWCLESLPYGPMAQTTKQTFEPSLPQGSVLVPGQRPKDTAPKTINKNHQIPSTVLHHLASQTGGKKNKHQHQHLNATRKFPSHSKQKETSTPTQLHHSTQRSARWNPLRLSMILQLQAQLGELLQHFPKTATDRHGRF